MRVKLNNLVSRNAVYCFKERTDYERFKGTLIVDELLNMSDWQNRCVTEIPSHDNVCFHDDELELVEDKLEVSAEKTFTLTNKKTIMSNLITTFKNITRTEPNKTFVKAGVMNEDLSLTSEGKELFIQFMFDKHATEFKTEVVDAILAEQEKK